MRGTCRGEQKGIYVKRSGKKEIRNILGLVGDIFVISFNQVFLMLFEAHAFDVLKMLLRGLYCAF